MSLKIKNGFHKDVPSHAARKRASQRKRQQDNNSIPICVVLSEEMCIALANPATTTTTTTTTNTTNAKLYQKFLAQPDVTMGGILQSIRCNVLNIVGPKASLWTCVLRYNGEDKIVDEYMPQMSSTLGQIYSNSASEDGFLYIYACQENVFGGRRVLYNEKYYDGNINDEYEERNWHENLKMNDVGKPKASTTSTL